MSFLLVLWSACILDLLFGDPRWFPHPVRLIGWFATRIETVAGGLPLSSRNGGMFTVVLVLSATATLCAAVFLMLSRLPLPGFHAGAAFILYTTVAARDLIGHARRVFDALGTDLVAARDRVGMIVGRDTDQLDESSIIRACVESVAENMSDGIVAPLFWATVGAVLSVSAGGVWPVVCGVTAAMLYKAVNTMDSMFGYKNEQYMEFGSCPARLDDVVNFLPARISGLALVLAAPLCGASMRNSWAVLCRDREKHPSPNAGWPEAAVAGALGLQLGGDSWYFGKLSSKPVLGESYQPPVPNHILKTNRLVVVALILCLLFFSSSYFLLRNLLYI